MSKGNKILKVLMEMIKDGITRLLVFVGLIIMTTVLAALVFSPVIICTIIFGSKIGVIVLFCEVGGILLWGFTYEIIHSFKRRMSRYE